MPKKSDGLADTVKPFNRSTFQPKQLFQETERSEVPMGA